MDSYDSEKRRIFQHFSRSTRFAFFCTAPISKFQLNFIKLLQNFCKNLQFHVNFIVFRADFDEKSSEFHEISRNFVEHIQS